MAKSSCADFILDRAFDDHFFAGQKKKQQSQPQFPKAEAIAARVREDLHLPHQVEFLNDTTHRVLGMVAGYRAGKSISLAGKSVLLAIANPGCDGLILAPTNSLVHSIIMPLLANKYDQWGLPYRIRMSPLPNITVYFDGFSCKIYLRSFESHNRLIGFTAGWALVDEVDTVPHAIADLGWKKVNARVSDPNSKVRQIGLVSTPEGFGFMYEAFVTKAGDMRHLISAKTTDNPYLPDDYVPSLMEDYPPELVKAYINGEFVNFNTSSVYPDFDKDLNGSDRTVKAEDVLYIGQDFNINKMASVVFVKDGQWPCAVDEFTKLRDTAAMIAAIKQRYPEHARKGMIWIYPDASGGSHHTNASKSDIELIREAGLKVNSPPANPPIRDRILTVNTLILNARGERRFGVNVAKCPNLVKTLTQQGYDDNGYPDKTTELDHLGDAMGYFLHRDYSFIHQRAGSGTGINLY